MAARAREISARTGGLILAQLLFDLTRAGGRADRVLDAPTNEAWIDPWVAHLRGLGVDLRLSTPVEGLTVRGGRIAGVTTPAGTVTADYYVAALPVEIMRTLAGPPLRALEPRLAGLDRLVTRWMNGILFYLDRDVPLVHGHAIYIDSEWALTSISQAQFWDGVDLERYGDGRVKGILSVDVSDWTTPGQPDRQGRDALHARGDPRRGLGPAHRPPQRRAAAGARRAPRADLVPRPGDRVPEPDRGDQPRAAADQHGGLVGRPAGRRRRGSRTSLLAADYVRTNTDLATMEGANEAARRRSTRSSTRTGSRAPRCKVFTLREPGVLKPARTLDALRWRLFHRPARTPLTVAGDGGLEPRNLLARGVLAAGGLSRRLGR